MTRTPLTYYGGKQMAAPAITALMPPHRVYLEPFAGGAAVLFAKRAAERETLNDADHTVMRFWRALRDRPDELAAAVSATPYARAEWAGAAADADDDVEAARRLLVEIDQSFSRGRESWSVPCVATGGRRGRWQPATWANLPPKLLAAAERLHGVALENGNALDLIPRWDVPGALLYCDPPYVGPQRLNARKGYRVDVGDTEDLWPRLVDLLLSLEHAQVILSGYPCDEVAPLLSAGWAQIPLRRRRTVQARDGEPLAHAPETVWCSPGITARQLTLMETTTEASA